MPSTLSQQLPRESIPKAVPLAGGDCFLLAPGTSYTLRDHPRTRPRSFCEVAPRAGSQVIQYGGGGAADHHHLGMVQICSAEREAPGAPASAAHTCKGGPGADAGTAHDPEHARVGNGEPAPGSELVVNRLADVLFIQCLRAHIGSRSETCEKGWLRAIFDPQIGGAIKFMHERIENPWTVESLAAACGMSRSAFALRFKEVVGETPLEYLTSWRMHKATTLLEKGDRKLVEVAESVGYDSDASFSKAFKRVLGVAPRGYRRSSLEASRS